MTGPTIEVQLAGRRGTLRVSHPDRYNAMTLSMWHALAQGVHRLAADPAVRLIELRGAGERAFVSGADISEFDASRQAGAASAAYEQAVQAAQQALATCAKPTIARIHGICMGGGIGLALACDLRYASSTARFRMPAAMLGLGYGLDAMQQLVDAVGAARARDLFLTARSFDGVEAGRIGLVHEVFAPEQVDNAVDALAERIAGLAPLTLQAAKAAIRHCQWPEGAPGREAIAGLVAACFDSQDYAEGRRAFAEKRAPQFHGR